jgi:hypothetical protein
MIGKKVEWPEPMLEKLLSLYSDHYTQEETNDYMINLILESEDLLLNPAIGMTYVEEFGEFKGLFRIVIRKFKIFYKVINEDIVVVAILFPGEK